MKSRGCECPLRRLDSTEQKPQVSLFDDAGGAVEAIARPMLDALWQAAGLERCFDYDDAGGWSPK